MEMISVSLVSGNTKCNQSYLSAPVSDTFSFLPQYTQAYMADQATLSEIKVEIMYTFHIHWDFYIFYI